MKLIIDISEDDLRLCPRYIQGDIVLSRIVNAVKKTAYRLCGVKTASTATKRTSPNTGAMVSALLQDL